MTLQSNFHTNRNPSICNAAVKLSSISSPLHPKLTHPFTHSLHGYFFMYKWHRIQLHAEYHLLFPHRRISVGLLINLHIENSTLLSSCVSHLFACFFIAFFYKEGGRGSWCSYIFWRFRVRMSAELSDIMYDFYRDFLQTLQEHIETLLKTGLNRLLQNPYLPTLCDNLSISFDCI
jgi:hypothetical protein